MSYNPYQSNDSRNQSAPTSYPMPTGYGGNSNPNLQTNSPTAVQGVLVQNYGNSPTLNAYSVNNNGQQYSPTQYPNTNINNNNYSNNSPIPPLIYVPPLNQNQPQTQYNQPSTDSI